MQRNQKRETDEKNNEGNQKMAVSEDGRNLGSE
jgi:hypothetical protein